ncbi:MAG: hypothetical protein ACK468_04330, partial [Dolichospermum sp.]
ENLGDTRCQPAAYPTAVPSRPGVPPGNNRPIALQRCKGIISGENLSHATAKVTSYPTADPSIN